MESCLKPIELSLTRYSDSSVAEVWRQVLPLVDGIVAASRGSITADGIFEFIVNGDMQLWVTEGDGILAIAITEIVRYPRKTVCKIFGCTGNGMKEWLHFMDEIEAWAAANGCRGMKHEARKGWARILAPKGYEMTHVILEKEL